MGRTNARYAEITNSVGGTGIDNEGSIIGQDNQGTLIINQTGFVNSGLVEVENGEPSPSTRPPTASPTPPAAASMSRMPAANWC